MITRTLMNGAVHFAGGVAFGILTLFAAKGAADLLKDERRGRSYGGGGGATGRSGTPTSSDQTDLSNGDGI